MGPNFGKTFQTSALTIQLAEGANHVPYLPRNFAYKKPRWFTKGNYVPVTGTVTSIKRINHHVLLSKQLVRQQQHGPCSLCWKARLKNIVRWFVMREKYCYIAEKVRLISQANRAMFYVIVLLLLIWAASFVWTHHSSQDHHRSCPSPISSLWPPRQSVAPQGLPSCHGAAESNDINWCQKFIIWKSRVDVPL